MTFLNPAFLFGLIAASVPLILHLLNLRKLERIEFSSLMFLHELQKSKIKRLKIKQIILLILRTLLILFIVLAFARPYIPTSFGMFSSYSQSSVLILVDNSFSMEVSDELGSRFKQAKDVASGLVSQLKDGDEIMIANFSDFDNDKQLENKLQYSKNLNQSKEKIAKLNISNTSINFGKILQKLIKPLETAENLNKEIYIISDYQRNLHQTLAKSGDKLNLGNSIVHFIDIGGESKSEILNLNIDSVNIKSSIFSLNKPVELDVYVKNSSTKSVKSTVLSLELNNIMQSQKTFDLDAGKTQIISISGTPKESGIIEGKIKLESDGLDRDNTFYFTFVVPNKSKVALIGNKNDIELANLALTSFTGEGGIIEFDQYSPSELSSVNLNNYETVIAASGPFKPGDFQRLKSWINNGGNLILFYDEKTSYNDFSSILNEYDLKYTGVEESNKQAPIEFSKYDAAHPLFEGVFENKKNKNSKIESPKIYSFLPIKNSNGLIETDRGSFLVESKIGNGKLLYFAASMDLSSSNFAITGLFPTLLYRSLIYFANTGLKGFNELPNQTVSFTLPKKDLNSTNIKMVDMSGKESFQKVALLPSSALITLDIPDNIGSYKLYNSENKPISSFSVNLNPKESELKYNSKNETEMYFSSILGDNFKNSYSVYDGNIEKNISRAKLGTELWKFFVVLALLCAFAEMLVERNKQES